MTAYAVFLLLVLTMVATLAAASVLELWRARR